MSTHLTKCWLISILIRIFAYIDCLVQDGSNSIANALEVLQSCTKPSICSLISVPSQWNFAHKDSCVVLINTKLCCNHIFFLQTAMPIFILFGFLSGPHYWHCCQDREALFNNFPIMVVLALQKDSKVSVGSLESHIPICQVSAQLSLIDTWTI